MKKYEQQKDIFEQLRKREGSDIDVKQSMDSLEKSQERSRSKSGTGSGQYRTTTSCGQVPLILSIRWM